MESISDNKCEFLIPVRKKVPVPTRDGRKVRIEDDDYALLCEMYNESTLSFKELVGACVRFAYEHAVYVKDGNGNEK